MQDLSTRQSLGGNTRSRWIQLDHFHPHVRAFILNHPRQVHADITSANNHHPAALRFAMTEHVQNLLLARFRRHNINLVVGFKHGQTIGNKG